MVIEPGVVIFDGRHWQRGNDTTLPAKLLATFGMTAPVRLIAPTPRRLAATLGDGIDAGVIDRAIRGEEAVGNHVIRHDESQGGQPLGSDQYALARGGALSARRACREQRLRSCRRGALRDVAG